jgi:uroporphyrinogen decarboxylase
LSAAEGLERDPAKWRTVLTPTYEALSLTRAGLAPHKALLGFAGAPWTLAVYLAGGGNDEQKAARLWAYRDPDGFEALIALLADCVAQHLIWQFQAGASAVQIFDSWAAGLPPALFARFVAKPTAVIVEKVRQAVPNAPIIGFPRGANPAQLHLYAEQTKVDGISLDPSIDLSWAVEELGVVAQGNLDPLALIAGGAALEDAVAAILAATKGKPFVFNLGHGILPPTPIDHVHKLIELIRSAT